jgi:hypothetical protein
MLVVAVVLLAGAAVLFARFVRERRPSDDLSYFYDLSEKKLFTASRTLVPPIRGINDEELDGVRAVVVSTNGDPGAPASRRIAYLEKYSPELKRQLEAMQSGGEFTAPAGARISRGAAQSFTFVRRLNEETWHAVNSVEAEKIMTEWQVLGPNGAAPVVCVP